MQAECVKEQPHGWHCCLAAFRDELHKLSRGQRAIWDQQLICEEENWLIRQIGGGFKFVTQSNYKLSLKLSLGFIAYLHWSTLRTRSFVLFASMCQKRPESMRAEFIYLPKGLLWLAIHNMSSKWFGIKNAYLLLSHSHWLHMPWRVKKCLELTYLFNDIVTRSNGTFFRVSWYFYSTRWNWLYDVKRCNFA